MNVINLVSYYMGIGELRFLDWAAAVIYGTKPESFAEAVLHNLPSFFLLGFLE